MYESGEDYLEAILMIQEQNGSARSIDVARKLNVSKPSVSRAMRILREEGLIVVGDDGGIKLTKAGSKRAISVYERHTLITDFFSQFLGVNPVTAEKDACKIEHVISEETYLRLRSFMTEKGYSPKELV